MKNKLTILGTGTCVSSFYKQFDFRNPPAYLLQFMGKNYLLDCSENVRGRLEKIKFDYYNLDVIFISHFHPDHFNLDSLLQSVLVRAVWYKKRKKIDIYGPENIEKISIDFWTKKHYEGAYHEHILRYLDIHFYEFSNATSVTLDESINFAPFKVFHAGGRMDAFAIRFELNNKILTYSGDSGICDGIYKACKNADLFLCEAAINIGETSTVAGHLNPFQAGTIAKKRGVKHLILTHYTGKNSHEAMKNDVERSGFKGKIYIASDFDIIPL